MYFIARRLFGTAQELRRLMDDNLKRMGLTAPQIHLLGFLDRKRERGEGCIQRELCAACGDLRASSVTSLIKTLEEAGYIVRETGEDAREKHVSLTEQGVAIAKSCRRYMDRVEEAFVRGFSEEQIQAFLGFLEGAKSNLEQFSKGE